MKEKSVPAQRILLVEDDPGVRRSTQLLLKAHGYDVRAYAVGSPMIADVDILPDDCVVTDYRLPDMDGLAVVSALRDRGWSGRAILVTAFDSPELQQQATHAGFDACLAKPVTDHFLLKSLRRVLDAAAAG